MLDIAETSAITTTLVEETRQHGESSQNNNHVNINVASVKPTDARLKELNSLNHKKLKNLRYFLGSLEKALFSYSMSHSGMFSSTY